MNTTILSHITLLLSSVHKASQYLKTFCFPMGSPQQFENEGTREIYMGNLELQNATLLLMEPIKEGPYFRAMAKRGPSLHHIAIDVLHLEQFIDHISSSGWLLHPKSLKTIKEQNTAYLCRPNLPTLIEVQQKKQLLKKPYFIEEIKIPRISKRELEMFYSLGIKQVTISEQGLSFKIQGHFIYFNDLI
jgi:hypothetical protein